MWYLECSVDITNGDEFCTSPEPFDGGDFAEYRERIEFYFCANSIGVVRQCLSGGEESCGETRNC